MGLIRGCWRGARGRGDGKVVLLCEVAFRFVGRVIKVGLVEGSGGGGGAVKLDLTDGVLQVAVRLDSADRCTNDVVGAGVDVVPPDKSPSDAKFSSDEVSSTIDDYQRIRIVRDRTRKVAYL